jgi:NTP pyrophosphatase (non-canonical NTP hydrolase)
MKEITERLKKFRDDRNWSQFHTPQNLAKSIMIEAAELLENYQFGSEGDLENIKEELADIMGYCLLLSEHYGFDIKTIINDKIDKNEIKYPVDKAFNTSKKYNKL